MRIGMLPARMTLHDADALEYFLRGLPGVTKATAHERTGNAIISYTCARSELIDAIRHFHYDDVTEDLSMQVRSREMTREYTEKLVMKITRRYLRKLFMPISLRHIRTVVRSVPYLWGGVRCLLHGKLRVELLDALSIGISILRGDYNTASSVRFLLEIGDLLDEWTHKKTVDDLARTMSLNIDKVWIKTDDDTSDIIWEEDNGTKFYEMWGVDYDDPKWEELINNMTLEEAQYLATYGGPSIPGASTIGTVETYMTENAGNGVAVNLNASKDTGAPWNIAADDPNGNWHPEVFGNSPLTASSFNPQLCYDLGAFVGEESLFTGIPILWGPGLNTHRHAYNGRNGEYYSEDPILSGVTAMEFAVGALKYGLIAAPKHYAFNDQETNRSGVAPYMTEQRAREVELRAYQYAFEATKYDTPEFDQGMRGLMISFSKIGPVECTASVGLMTNILAKEWGFRGYAVTDIYDDFDIYGAVLTSGATCYDTRGMAGFYTNTTLDGGRFADQVDGSVINAQVFAGDATAQNAIKASVHKILFAMSQSNLMNRYDPTTRVVKLPVVWRTAYQTAEYAFGALMVCSAVLYLVAKLRKKEEK